jgi:VCBS repeat-containing protein
MAKKSGTSANDELIGGARADKLYGKHGDDLLDGGAGNDRLEGGAGDDLLAGGDGKDTLFGGSGNDLLEGGADNDKLIGQSGHDSVDGGTGNDRLEGGDGDDDLEGGDGNDKLYGGRDHDWLSGGEGDDRLHGGAGDDRLEGGNGDDRLDGTDGNDELNGGAGDDYLTGGDDDDALAGGDDNDTLFGGSGHDLLEGGDGDDKLVGQSGRDSLTGGAGDDRLHGGSGDDLFLYGTGDGNDEVVGDSGSDTIRLHADAGWSLDLSKGKVVSEHGGEVQLSGSAAGTITLADGSTIRFRDVERIETVPSDPDGQPLSVALVAEPVAENAPDGSVVGTAMTTEPGPVAALASGGAGDGLTYSLTDDAGGRFAIDPHTGVVTVADDALLDYESATQHDIEVTVTDPGGNSVSKVFTIEVADVNEAPSIQRLDSSEVAEGAAAGTVVGTVAASDPDMGDALTYALTDDGGGRFAIDPHSGVITVASPEPDASPEPVASWALNSSFDGQDQKVVIGHDPSFELDQGTVSLRFTADHVTGKQGLFSKDSLDFDDGGHLSVWLEDGQVVARLQSDSESYHLRSAPGAVTAGEQIEVAVSFGDEGFRLYVGGELVDQSSYTGGIAANQEPLVVGADAQRSGDGTAAPLSDFFAGTIHDLAVYDQQLEGGQPSVAAAAALEDGSASHHDIEVTVTDAAGLSATQSFTITVNGVNEAPGIGGLDSSEVAENAVAGTVVGTVAASDPDAGDSLAYALSDDAGGRFAIDPDTGVITVAEGALLDHEGAAQHDVTATVTDGEGHSASETFTITVQNANEAPEGLALSANQVTEDATNGSVVGTVSATDPDSGDTLTYALTDDAGGRFAIDPHTGVITVADGTLLDYENAAQHGITVEVTDAGGLSASQTFTIDVGQAAGQAPGGIALSGGAVTEGVAGGTVVGTVSATDPDGDAVTYSLSDDAGGRFAIDPDTGVITVAGGAVFDHESAAQHDITVEVTDAGGLSTTRHLVIEVVDANETPGTIGLDGSEVAENAAAGTVVGTAGAADPDDGDTLTYSLSDDAGGRFAIDPNTGVVTVAEGAVLDHESAAQHDITVQVTDAGGLSDSRTFTVAVADINEAPAVIALDPGAVAENAAAGTVVGTVSAGDPDNGDTLTYSLSDDAGGRFAIDPDTGVVTVADGSLLDHESAAQHDIAVQVTDAGGLSDSRTFAVAVADVNEAPTVLELDSGTVAENAATGTVVGTVAAADPDDGDTLTYALSDDAGGRFAIDPNTGVVTVADGSLLDHESATQHDIGVTVTDAGGLSASQTFTIAVANVNEQPVLQTLSASDVIEGAANGTVVGTVSALEPDMGDTLTYALTDDAGGRFAIDPSTGVVTVADGTLLDYESAAQHSITVAVTDAGGLSDSATYVIELQQDYSGDNELFGGAGADVIDGGPGNDSVFGEAGNDHLLGSSGEDSLHGGGGNDLLEGGDDNDFLFGDGEDDQLFGGMGDDQLFGGMGNDLLDGSAGSDELFGGSGDDVMSGGEGNDSLFASLGNDVLAGSAGDDVLSGGEGGDRFVFTSPDGVDEILDFETGDVLAIGELLVGFAEGDEAAFVRLVDDGANNTTTVQVNADGVGEDYQSIAVLDEVSGIELADLVSAGQIDFWMS